MDHVRATQQSHHQRLNDLENKIDLVSKMGGKSKGGNGSDMLDALQDIQDSLRKEFDDKLDALRDDLMKKIKELEENDNK